MAQKRLPETLLAQAKQKLNEMIEEAIPAQEAPQGKGLMIIYISDYHIGDWTNFSVKNN